MADSNATEKATERVAGHLENTAQEVLIANMLMSGSKTKEIAEKLGRELKEVNDVLARPGVRRYLRTLKDSIEERVVAEATDIQTAVDLAAENALRVLVDIADGTIEGKTKDRVDAAKIILAHASGLQKAQAKSQGGTISNDKHVHLHLSPSQTANMKRAMQDIGKLDMVKKFDKAIQNGEVLKQ